MNQSLCACPATAAKHQVRLWQKALFLPVVVICGKYGNSTYCVLLCCHRCSSPDQQSVNENTRTVSHFLSPKTRLTWTGQGQKSSTPLCATLSSRVNKAATDLASVAKLNLSWKIQHNNELLRSFLGECMWPVTSWLIRQSRAIRFEASFPEIKLRLPFHKVSEERVVNWFQWGRRGGGPFQLPQNPPQRSRSQDHKIIRCVNTEATVFHRIRTSRCPQIFRAYSQVNWIHFTLLKNPDLHKILSPKKLSQKIWHFQNPPFIEPICFSL